MNINIPTPEKMHKYPWATTSVSLFAVCVLLIIFLLKKPDNCESEEWKEAYNSERTKNDVLTTALLIKNGVIFKQEQDKRELDSTIRQKIGERAKKIIGDK